MTQDPLDDMPAPSDLTIEEIRSARNAYDGTIAYLDSQIKLLFGGLKQRGLLNRTLIVVVSDHGEEFGEHGTMGHGLDLYIQSIHVPLILRLPGVVPTGITVQAPVTIRDIPTTIIVLLGLPETTHFPGRPLSRYWEEGDRKVSKTGEFSLSELLHAPWEPEWAPVSKGEMKSFITGNMHYIRNGDGTEEVYNLRHDPVERNNIIKTPRGANAAEHARSALEQMVR